MQMTARKSLIIKWSILVLLIAYSSWMVVWGHQEAARHVCTGIEVKIEGNSLPGQNDSIIRRGVLQELKRHTGKIVGVPLTRLNARVIEEELGKLNNFESVHCVLTSEGKLQVRVRPLVPVMRVFFADNSYYINKDGKHIPSNPDFFTEVPIVGGRFTRTFQPKDVLPLVNFVRHDEMLEALTSMIVADGPNDLLIVPKVRGHVVNFGDTNRLKEKRDALSLFYRKVMPYKGWEEYDTISVKFRGQVVATRRDKTRVNHGEEWGEDIDLEESTLPEGEMPGNAHPAVAGETSGNTKQKPVAQAAP